MTQGEEIAAAFEQAKDQFAQTIGGLSDAQWRKTCADNGWTAGVAAHHVAESVGGIAQWVQSVASGSKEPPFSAQQLDEGNAEHAQRAANATRQETLALLDQNAAAATKMLRGLTDEQLARTQFVQFAGAELPASQIAQAVLIGHFHMHAPGIQAAASS